MGSKRKGIQQFEHWSPSISGKASEELVNSTGNNHFATRQRANEFVRLMRSLPTTDPILRKMGKSITALQELLTDSHIESVWSVRCSVASGAEWFISAGAGGRQEKEAVEYCGYSR
jgi:hypothetical protein